ncbi:MAG: GNAT family N-acetyltransferase [Thermoplasmatales archaeon]|nr:GNAT family N-acetyltransferase [Candidatus Thermoplasmatota archaeon]MCL6003596.1 GNAT family N-acetyltransferase [Candidatus Thermoplasmatota archaeon]MDA8054759.1 GNAT family N-acetyltransferase [Thermoplasmatales archaeon]
MEDIKIRDLKREDLKEATNLVMRLKKFNSEHDPLFNVSEELEKNVTEYLASAIKLETRDVLVADFKKKIVGVIMGEILTRPFYNPSKELRVTEIYLLPEYRKGGLGKKLLDSLIEKEKGKSCNIITVEFPSENLLAHKFYTGLGMRSILSIYGKQLKK